MYKIVSITDKQGNDKTDFYNELKSVHLNMSGKILYPEYTKIGGCLCFVWNDNTEKMLRTSTIERLFSDEDRYIVETRNSIYTLKRENNNM